MRTKLEKITNLTINDLLNNKIILPSSYFEKFTNHAKKIEVNLDEEDFTNQFNQVILDDFNKIEEYFKIILSSAQILEENTKDAKTAILNKDNKSLEFIQKKMIDLQDEINSLNNQIYIDEILNTYNRKWIYNKFLDKNNTFQEDGICVSLDVLDYFYIQNEYKDALSRNLLLFVLKFVSEKLQDEKYEFKIARYLENKFFIFIFNKSKKEVLANINNLEQLLSNTTLKSNAGLIINTKYTFNTASFKKGDLANPLFESLLNQVKDK